MDYGTRASRLIYIPFLALALTAPSKAASSVKLSPGSLTFGTQMEGSTSAAKTATLTNGSTAAITISAITVSSNFVRGGGTCPLSPNKLASGASCSILVMFAPTALGDLTGTVTVTDDAANSPQTASLTGIGTSPVKVSPGSLTFAKLPVGETSSPQSVTLTNNQSVSVSISSIAASGDFAVASNTCGASVPALGTCAVGITFKPTATGGRTGMLTFTDSALNSPQTVSLNGSGAPPALLSIAVTPAFGILALGRTLQLTATGTFSNNTTQNISSTATWSTSPQGIASVSATGLATGMALGGTTVTAASSGISGSAVLSVTQPFLSTGSLNTARYYHSATMLNIGQVLVAGGIGPLPGGSGALGELASAELYNPNTGTFSFTGSLNVAREGHSATLLNNGTVLIAGGSDGNGELSSAELYRPTGASFTITGSLFEARYQHTATVLPNGGVLIAGGYSGGSTLSSAEIYDSAAGAFAHAGNLKAARFAATATLLPNGLVLIAGGADANGPLASAELYNPVSKAFTPTGSLTVARSGATATLLNNGLVLIADGYNYAVTGPLSSAELYNPATGTFAATGSLAQSLWLGTATQLTNGTVMVVGSIYASATAGIYSPFMGTFGSVSGLNTPGDLETATLLPSGTLLIAGGHSNSSNAVLTDAELYSPPTLTPTNLISIALTPATPRLRMGASQQFVATGTFSNNSTQQLASVVWSSSNPTIASVTSDATNSGVAYGLAAGGTTISACTGTLCGSTVLTVTGK